MQTSIWPYCVIAIALHVLFALCFVQNAPTQTVTLAGEGGQGIEVGVDQNTYQQLLNAQTKKKHKAELKPVKKQQTQQKQKPVKKSTQKRVIKKVATSSKVVQSVAVKKAIAPKSKQPTETGVLKTEVQAEKQLQIGDEQTAKTDNTHVAMLSTPHALSQPALVKVASNQATTNHQADGANNQGVSSSTASSKSMGSNKAAIKSDAFKAYIRKIMRHLKRYKTYPKALKQAHVDGTPVIKFTINQSGEVIETTIKRRSSNQALDQAAINVFKKANPLPPIPPSIKQDSLTMSLPIKYRLIND